MVRNGIKSGRGGDKRGGHTRRRTERERERERVREREGVERATASERCVVGGGGGARAYAQRPAASGFTTGKFGRAASAGSGARTGERAEAVVHTVPLEYLSAHSGRGREAGALLATPAGRPR